MEPSLDPIQPDLSRRSLLGGGSMLYKALTG